MPYVKVYLRKILVALLFEEKSSNIWNTGDQNPAGKLKSYWMIFLSSPLNLPLLVRCSLTCETFVCLLGSSLNHRPCAFLWAKINTIYQSQVSIRLGWHAAAGLAVLGGAGTGWAQGRGCTRSEGVQQELCCAVGRSSLGEDSGHSTGVWGSTSYPRGTARLHPPKYPVEVSPESQSCLRQSQSPIPSPGACMLHSLLSHFSQTKPNCSLISQTFSSVCSAGGHCRAELAVDVV